MIGLVDDAAKFTAREVRRGRRYDGIILDPPKYGRGPTGEIWRLEEDLPGLIADCRRLLDEESRFLVLTVYAVRMSALAIGELVRQSLGDLGGTVEAGEMAVREEARGLLLPTAIFARWSRDSRATTLTSSISAPARSIVAGTQDRFGTPSAGCTTSAIGTWSMSTS